MTSSPKDAMHLTDAVNLMDDDLGCLRLPAAPRLKAILLSPPEWVSRRGVETGLTSPITCLIRSITMTRNS